VRRTMTAGWMIAALMAAGCSTTNPFGREKLLVPAGPSYAAGRGMQMFPTSPTLLGNVKDAMTDVGMHSIRQVPEPNGAVALVATTADRRSTRLTIQTTGVRSLVAAKVGWLGDEPLTRALLDRIGARQGDLPPSAVPVDAPPEPPAPEPQGNPFFSRRAVSDDTMLRDRLDVGHTPSIIPPINP